MKTIAWDVDDVLNDLMRDWFENWWKKRNPGCLINYNELTDNPPHKILGIDKTDYLKSLDAYRLSGRYEQLKPNAKVMHWFQKQGRVYRHFALTAVPRFAVSRSAVWVYRHFGDWIRTFHFIPSPRPNDIILPYEHSKAAYLKWLQRVDIFIDDHAGNINEVKACGIEALMPSRPWNDSEKSIDHILHRLS